MSSWRINAIIIVIFLFGAAIIGRLFFLQIIEHDFYKALSRGQQKFFVKSMGDRGEIFFKNHDLPIATNHAYKLVYISPNEITSEKKETTAQVLSLILGIDEKFILANLKKDSLYQVLKGKLNDQEIKALEKLDLAGVHFGSEQLRSYPYQSLASQVLGFVNKDGRGQYGLEEYWDEILQGKELNGRGSDVLLTIDYNIQYFAEKLLQRAHKNLNIVGGTIMAMDPDSGKILALANFPNFDPNEYSKEKNLAIFQSEAIQKIFEPGSVFKPITMAGALNENAITPQTVYQDPGSIKIGGWLISNYDQRTYPGEITMTQVLEKSINTGAVFAESELGHKNFAKYIEKFGIFEKTGIDLAGEIVPKNQEFKRGQEINFTTASFGQGIEMTPLQIARAFSAIANGGKLVKPYIVEKIRNPDNKIIETKPQIAEGVISQSTASKLTAMLVSVIENGFGKAAKIPGYYIAGKTGTAQVSFASLGIDKEGYSDQTWQTFIGFAPAFDAKFLIIVKLNNPATKTAEYSAVPLFKELAQYIIDYYHIPPDYE